MGIIQLERHGDYVGFQKIVDGEFLSDIKTPEPTLVTKTCQEADAIALNHCKQTTRIHSPSSSHSAIPPLSIVTIPHNLIVGNSVASHPHYHWCQTTERNPAIITNHIPEALSIETTKITRKNPPQQLTPAESSLNHLGRPKLPRQY